MRDARGAVRAKRRIVAALTPPPPRSPARQLTPPPRPIRHTLLAISELDGQPATPLDGFDLAGKTLGECRRDSPLASLLYDRRSSHHWVDASDRVLVDDTAAMARARGVPVERLPGCEAGGPRRKIFCDPSTFAWKSDRSV